MEKGKTYSAFITDVNYYSGKDLSIWAQVGDDTEGTLNDITATLHENSSSAQILLELHEGCLCACKYNEDEQWYRASLVKLTANGKWVARFIDYGNSQIFNENEIFQLPKELIQIPPLATPLYLNETICPLQSAGLWTSKAIKTLLDLLLYNEVEVVVTRVSQEKIQIACKTVTDTLVAKGLAKIDPSGAYPFSEFSVNQKFSGFVLNASTKGVLSIQKENSSLLLNDLMAEMTKHFPGSTSLSSENVEPGTLVAAMYKVDQNFYRAQVLAVDGDTCSLLYIDYGNKEDQDISTVFELPKQFSSLPYQAVDCELHDVIIFPNKCSQDLKTFVMDEIDFQLVKVEIKDHALKLDSDFFVTVEYQEKNLSLLLVAKSFAKLRRCTLESLEYKYVKVDAGSQHTAYISHAEPDGVFYVSLMNETCKLDKLMDELADYCPEAKPLVDVFPGLCCCALYDEDDSWYRALVLSVDGEQCSVMFVDYGNSSPCNVSSLRLMPRQFMELSCQAIGCKILRPLITEEVDLLQNKIGEMVEVKFLTKSDIVNSYHVKVVQDDKNLFPPVAKRNFGTESFKKLAINLGSTEKIKVLSFDSPEAMWGRLVSNENILQELCNNLNKVYKSDQAGKLDSNHKLEVEAVCVVQDVQFKQWCRGIVVEAKNNDETYSVRLVDVGIIKEYSVAQLRKIISDDFFGLPPQAFRFALAELISVSMDALKAVDLSSFFVDNSFSAKFISYDDSNQLYQVELFDDIGLPIETVLSEIVKCGGIRKYVDLPCDTHEHLAKLQVIPIDNIAVEVAVSFVEDPDCMWLHLQSNSKVLFRLLEEMKTFYSNLPSNVLSFQQPQYDALCAVKIRNKSEENWYRGRILCLYSDIIEVKLIDFGNEVQTKQKDIKRLASKFSHTEPQAIKTKLYNISPCSKAWSNVAVREVTRLANESSITYATFIEQQRTCYVVDLELRVDDNAIKVSEFLVKEKMAVWQDESVVANVVEPDEIDSVSQRANDHHSPIPKVRPKLFYQSPGVAFIGAEIEVSVSEVSSPDDFFLQINDACHRQKYTKLIKQLNSACIKGTEPVFDGNLYIGQPCAVFYDRVQQWCRGAILNYSDLENIEICLVDFGSVVSYPLNEVASIDSSLVVKAPPEAMRCTLQGIVRPMQGSWCSEASKLCKDFFESDQGNLICTVHACAGNNVCSYFICSVRTPLRNLADDLVKAGLGVKTTAVGKVDLPLKLKSYIYSNLNQVKGKEDKYFVAHVEAPNLFYCQLVEHFQNLDSMMEKLQCHCETTANSCLTVDELIQDCMCFAKFLDQWYRAHFVSVGSDDFIKVLFVDYGNTAFVHINEIQKFSESEFYELPIQALPCSLKDVDAASNSLEDQKLLLIEMNNTIFEKEFDGLVIGSTNGKLHLDLFQEGKRINDLIIKNTSLCNPVAETDEGEKLFNSSKRDTITSLNEPSILKPGSSLYVTIASCSNPNAFYLWLNGLENQRASCISALDGMYTAMRNADYTLKDVHPGDFVSAKRSKDMKWCRAKVVDSTETDVEVFCVDSGETDTVSKAFDVKQLMAKVGDYPIMAISCRLFTNVPLSDDDWSSQAVAEFHKFVRTSQLTAKFLNRNALFDKWQVILKNDGTDFATHLKNLGVPLFDESSKIQATLEYNLEIELPFVWQDERQVYISYVASEKEIFVQDVSALEAVKGLEVYMDKEDLVSFDIPPESHAFCLARYEEDDQIYRVEILNILDDDSYNVKFVDYGNTTVSKLADLFILNKICAAAPQAAVQCKLNSISNDLSSDELISKLNDLSFSEDLTIFATFTQNEAGDENQVLLRVQKADETSPMSLESYFLNFSSDQVNEEVEENGNDLHYSVMENVLNQASRSIYVSHVENPGHIFCQLSEFCDELDVLMSNIEAYYQEERSDDMIQSTSSLSIGSPCIAKYEADDAWYRAVVEEITDSENLTVRFIDYGNLQPLSVSDVRQTKIGFCILPAQALQCFVAQVDHNADEWTPEETEDFDERVASLQLKATFTRLVDERQNIFEVLLRLPDETLLNNEYSSKSTKGNADAFIESEKNNVVQEEIVAEVSAPTLPSPSFSRCTLQHIAIKEGSIRDCFISYAENVNIFYLQVAGTEKDLNSLYDSALSDSQANVNETIEFDQLFPCNSYCVAKSPDDEEWYRGQIIKIETKPTVLFVDYGNCSILEWNSIKPLSRETAVLPIQAIPCAFGNRFKFNKEVLDDAVKIFFELVDSSLLTVCFLKMDGVAWNVSIRSKGVDVAEKVIADLYEKYPDLSSRTDETTEDLPATICPDTILIGQVISADDVENIFVKINDAKTFANSVRLETCLVKLSEEDSVVDAVRVVVENSDDLFMVDDACYLKHQVYEINDCENPSFPAFSVFRCKLSDCKGSSISSSLLISHLLNKDVFVIFKSFDSDSSKWEVEMEFSSGGLRKSLFDHVDESLSSSMHNNDKPKRYNSAEDCLLYCQQLFKQCKELSADSPSSGKVMDLVGEALNAMSAFKSSKSNVDAEINFDDHKRPFSEFLSIPAPCKKPKLEKQSCQNNQTKTPSQQPEKHKLVAFSILPSAVRHATIFSVDSPSHFYAKPEFVTISLFEIICSDLKPLEDLKSHSLCAFCPPNGSGSSKAKRGYILQHSESKVIVFDIDSGLEHNLNRNQVFAYASQWNNQKAPVVICSLFNVSSFDEAWSDETCSYFRRFIAGPEKTVFVKFIKQCASEGPLSKWLVDVIIDDKSLCKLLVENKLAYWTMEDDETLSLLLEKDSPSSRTDNDALFPSTQEVGSSTVENDLEDNVTETTLTGDEVNEKLLAASDLNNSFNRQSERVPRFIVPISGVSNAYSGDNDENSEASDLGSQQECYESSVKESVELVQSENVSSLENVDHSYSQDDSPLDVANEPEIEVIESLDSDNADPLSEQRCPSFMSLSTSSTSLPDSNVLKATSPKNEFSEITDQETATLSSSIPTVFEHDKDNSCTLLEDIDVTDENDVKTDIVEEAASEIQVTLDNCTNSVITAENAASNDGHDPLISHVTEQDKDNFCFPPRNVDENTAATNAIEEAAFEIQDAGQENDVESVATAQKAAFNDVLITSTSITETSCCDLSVEENVAEINSSAEEVEISVLNDTETALLLDEVESEDNVVAISSCDTTVTDRDFFTPTPAEESYYVDSRSFQDSNSCVVTPTELEPGVAEVATSLETVSTNLENFEGSAE